MVNTALSPYESFRVPRKCDPYQTASGANHTRGPNRARGRRAYPGMLSVSTSAIRSFGVRVEEGGVVRVGTPVGHGVEAYT